MLQQGYEGISQERSVLSPSQEGVMTNTRVYVSAFNWATESSAACWEPMLLFRHNRRDVDDAGSMRHSMVDGVGRIEARKMPASTHDGHESGWPIDNCRPIKPHQ